MIRHKTTYEEYKNVKLMYDAHEQRLADQEMIRYFKGKEVASVYGKEFYAKMHKIAYYFQKMGYARKHIGLMGNNSVEWLLVFSAIVYTGNVSILFSKDFSEEEMKKAAVKTDCDILIYDDLVADRVKDTFDASEMTILSLAEIWEEGLVEDESFVADSSMITNDTTWEDLICIIFTSGTTGEFKAVMASNRAFTVNATSATTEYVVGPYDSSLILLPFHHLAGFSTCLNQFFTGKCACIGDSPQYLFRYFKKLKPQGCLLVPAMIEEVRKRIVKADYDQTKLGWDLSYIGSGGAKFDTKVLEDFLKSGIKIGQVYSASEMFGQGIMNNMSEGHIDSIGKPVSCVEARVVDGELQLSGPTVMSGYYKDPELTAEVLQDGWYLSGDLARVDEDGFFYLTGRKKNLIILSNGENVSPEGIEHALSACACVEEVLVYEENDRIVCDVYPSEQSDACKKEVETYIEQYNAGVPGYKKIYHVTFLEEPFPKTAIGKIVRK